MAMQSNEVVTNDAYCQALSRDVSGDIRALVERNFADEQRHLDTIRARLEGTVIAGPLLSEATMVQGWMTAFWMNGLWSLSPR